MSLSQVLSCELEGGGDGWGVLLPHLAGVVVEEAAVAGGQLVVRARPRAGGACCPECGGWSGRVHSRYERRLADAPVGARPAVIALVVRRLFCPAAGCQKKTFTEQVAGVTVRYGRRTVLLSRLLGAVAVRLAGRPGAGLAAALGVVVSRATLLRLVRALPVPPAGLVRVLGVDDFAIRRGAIYATVLTDIEAGHPVEVLPGRDAAALASWLEQHPEVEVICRDRAGGYAEGARTGAPQAIQVADRWHLQHGLGGYARQAVRACAPCLAAWHAGQVAAARQAGSDPWAALPPAAADRLAAWLPLLRQRWDEGITSIAALHRAAAAAGYPGSYRTFYACLRPVKAAAAALPPVPAPPAISQVTAWILRNPATLDDSERASLAAVRACCPHLDTLARHVAEFAVMLTQLQGEQLDDWITDVEDNGHPALRPFTNGLRRDYDAVLAGLTQPWNSGPVEGLINKIKTIKRQMYGRASLPLLRHLILLTP